MQHSHNGNVVSGSMVWSPVKSLWWSAMVGIALVGGWLTFSWAALALFLAATATVLLFGHSLGSHRKLIHDSFACPKWLEYLLVYIGVQVGLSGPLGLLAQHDLRDYAQRQPDCHDYLRHGRSFWRDGWSQLHCELRLDHPPQLLVPPHIAQDRFYRFLERSWMLHQLPPALLLYALGGWPFVIWGVCARIAAGVTGHWLIGYFAHNHGAMAHTVEGAAVQGHNVALASLLTMGESWHNNHHAYPGSAKLGLYPGEWDPGWWGWCCSSAPGWHGTSGCRRTARRAPSCVCMRRCQSPCRRRTNRGVPRSAPSSAPADNCSRGAASSCWKGRSCCCPKAPPAAWLAAGSGRSARLHALVCRSNTAAKWYAACLPC